MFKAVWLWRLLESLEKEAIWCDPSNTLSEELYVSLERNLLLSQQMEISWVTVNVIG